jgi:hypothetical protein
MDIFRLFLSIIFLLATPQAYSAPTTEPSYIFETTDNVSKTSGGLAVSGNQWVGTRFEVNSTTYIDEVGGFFFSSSNANTGWVALVELNTVTLMPDGSPNRYDDFLTTSLWHEYITYPYFKGEDVIIDVDLILGPGIYGLVFGSHHLLSGGTIVTQRETRKNGVSFFSRKQGVHNTGYWDELDDLSSMRMFATTNSIPEPVTLTLICTGLVGMGFVRNRKRKYDRCT